MEEQNKKEAEEVKSTEGQEKGSVKKETSIEATQPKAVPARAEEKPAEVKSVDVKTSKEPERPKFGGGQNRDRKSKFRSDKNRKREDDSGFIEKVISIKRITKVTKGGKKLSFSALVVVGDTKGNVGYSLSKAREVAIAIRKAMVTAKKNMVKIPMSGSTITHEIIGKCGGAEVLLKPASEGTGVIAAGPVRAVCDGAGIHNILTKCHRSNNPINVVKATFEGLLRLKIVNVVEPVAASAVEEPVAAVEN